MVDVPLVREERALSVPDAGKEDTEDVHHRDEDDGHGIDKIGSFVCAAEHRSVDGGELDGEKGQKESHGQRACVTHEGLQDTGLSEGVVEVEHQKESEHRRCKKHVDVHVTVEEDHRIACGSHDAESGCKAVDAVNKVYRVDDQHYDHDRQRNSQHRMKGMDAQESVKVADPQACCAEHDGGEDLHHELDPVGDPYHVVHDADKVEDDATGHGKHDFGYRSVGEHEVVRRVDAHGSYDQKQREKDRRHKGKSSQTGNVSLVDLAVVL